MGTLTPGKRSLTQFAAPAPHDEEPELGLIPVACGAWPRSYHRLLNTACFGAVLMLGMLLGSILSGYAASLGSSSLLARPRVSTLLPATPDTVGDGVPVTVAALDARFAIVTLGIRCPSDFCEGSRHVPAGQRIYALQEGVSCTTASAVEVAARGVAYVYCRLDQPNRFTTAFNGAEFACFCRPGRRVVLRVETTNGR